MSDLSDQLERAAEAGTAYLVVPCSHCHGQTESTKSPARCAYCNGKKTEKSKDGLLSLVAQVRWLEDRLSVAEANVSLRYEYERQCRDALASVSEERIKALEWFTAKVNADADRDQWKAKAEAAIIETVGRCLAHDMPIIRFPKYLPAHCPMCAIEERDESFSEADREKQAREAAETNLQRLEHEIAIAKESKHGASGMCCSLREQAVKRAEAAETWVAELKTRLKATEERAEDAERRLAEAECWLLYTSDRVAGGTKILGIFDDVAKAWKHYHDTHDEGERYWRIPFVEQWKDGAIRAAAAEAVERAGRT